MSSGRGAKPGIFRVFFTDYWCVLLVFVTPLFVALSPFVALLLLVVPLRIHRIRRTFARGETAEAEVVGHGGRKGMYTVTYQFEVAGQTIKTSDDYLLFKHLPYRKGDHLEVVYDPRKPRRAWLKFRFLRERAAEERERGAGDSA
jgi:hypothetical protein